MFAEDNELLSPNHDGGCAENAQPSAGVGAGQRLRPRKYRPRGESAAVRVSEQLDRSGGPEACWPFKGRHNPDGYGVVDSGARSLMAHKVALETKLARALAAGEVTRHTCHNPPCCNPAHLVPGTRGDNSSDMVAAGRSLAGEKSPAAKLTQDQVLAILGRAKAGPINFEATGREFGVTGRQIAYIVERSRWAHVGGAL